MRHRPPGASTLAVPCDLASGEEIRCQFVFSNPVSVRLFGDHEMLERDLVWSAFQCVEVPLVAQKSEMVAQKSEMVAQKSEMAVRADRPADGHKSFIPKRLGSGKAGQVRY